MSNKVNAVKPDRLGKYRLDGIVGKGGMGVVYKGFDEDIERPVALKVLHGHLIDEDDPSSLTQRFKYEARAAARCLHSNIVTIFDYGVSDGAHYIAMEFIEGIDLKRLLRRETKIPYQQAMDLVFQVLMALEKAHEMGVVHRDIKPANIMIMENGQVKVADFGVARLASSDLTQAGYMIGTPTYMSPEGRMGKVVEGRSDLYSTGVVLYEIITGHRLDPDREDNTLIKSQLANVIEDASIVNQLHQVLSAALQKNPALRFKSAGEFSQRLGGILSPDQKHVPDVDQLAATMILASQKQFDELKASTDNAGFNATSNSTISEQALKQLENALMVHVGPMAPVLLRKYTKQCPDVSSLVQALSAHIPSEAEQSQFLTLISSSGLSSVANSSVSGTTTGTSMGGVAAGLAPALDMPQELMEKIGLLLTSYLGPLGPKMAKRAQRKADNLDELKGLLAERIPNNKEKTEFIKRLDLLIKS